jgi:hypothetical protein
MELMRFKALLLILLLLFAFRPLFAQDKGFTLLLGPAVNVFYGSPDDRFSYTPERIGWQFNGQLGYISTRGGTIRGNMLGIYGSAGSTKPQMVALMLPADAGVSGAVNMDKKFNEFYTLEAGMTVMKFLRASAGLGRQYYTYANNERGLIQYYSGSVGLSFNLGSVNWVIDAQLMAGKDLVKNYIKASTGFLVKF